MDLYLPQQGQPPAPFNLLHMIFATDSKTINKELCMDIKVQLFQNQNIKFPNDE
jgi:hypothetical protein